MLSEGSALSLRLLKVAPPPAWRRSMSIHSMRTPGVIRHGPIAMRSSM